MKNRKLAAVLVFSFAGTVTTGAWVARARYVLPDDLPGLAHAAAIASSPRRVAALERLRAAGPDGLAAIMAVAPPAGEDRRALMDWHDAVDRVAACHDAAASGLYWYTDLDQAKAAAHASGRPILSLRLLGRLDEELSCANSRFFRAVLYPSAEVNELLKQRFVLHWESVRPVPRLTIDFGDGRKLVTTITGNSIHYVLAPDGTVIDAVPGLWGSQAFAKEIARAADEAARVAALPATEVAAELQRWHEERLKSLDLDFRADFSQTPAWEWVKDNVPQSPRDGRFQDDLRFEDGSFTSTPEGSKASVELPFTRGLIEDAQPFRGVIPDEAWTEVAKLHASECALDERSRRFVLAKRLAGQRAGEGAGGGNVPELFLSLERSIAEDTVRNRYMLGRRLHEWLVDGSAPQDVGALNTKVYAELFASPVNDGFLGLVPLDAGHARLGNLDSTPELGARHAKGFANGLDPAAGGARQVARLAQGREAAVELLSSKEIGLHCRTHMFFLLNICIIYMFLIIHNIRIYVFFFVPSLQGTFRLIPLK